MSLISPFHVQRSSKIQVMDLPANKEIAAFTPFARNDPYTKAISTAERAWMAVVSKRMPPIMLPGGTGDCFHGRSCPLYFTRLRG